MLSDHQSAPEDGDIVSTPFLDLASRETSTPPRRHPRKLLAGALTAVLAVTALLTVAPTSALADDAVLLSQPAASTDTPVIDDDMDRTVGSGWGSSPKGAWRVVEGTASVTGEQALLASRKPGVTARATVDGVAAADVDSRFSLTVPELPVGGPLYLSQAVRVSGADSYGVRVRVHPDGSAYVSVVRLADLMRVQHLSERRLSLTVTSGTTLTVALNVTGTSPVTLAAKAWESGAAEPSEWQVTYSDDSDARIQAEGGYAFALYTSSGAQTAVPVGIDDVSVTTPVSVPEPSTEPTPTPTPTTEPSPSPSLPPTPTPTPTPPPTPSPVPESELEPVPPVTPEGVRGEPGAKAPGTLSYDAPARAVYVAPAGFDGASGTKNSPVKTIAAALRVVPNGGTIVLRGGSYHEEIVVPAQKRVTIQPAPNESVWLDGAKPVTGWKASGSTWYVDGWSTALDASPTYTKGAPDNAQADWRFVDPAHPMAAHPDQVWVAGVQLREVASASQVAEGTFFVDDSAKRLVIGTNPTGKSVEASVLTQALSIRSAGTEVRGIGVRRYATSVPQMGTVIAAAPSVSLTDVTIRDNSTTGFYSWAPGTTLTRVSLIGNGLLGGGASQADGLTVTQMLSVGNNVEHFNDSPVSGAFKVTRTRGVTVTDSAFTGNNGRGPWFDESVLDIAFTGNDVIGNTGHGVMVELSERAVVADNVIARNGEFGLFVLNSGNVKIWNNTFVGNGNRNISIGMDSRRASDPNTPGHDPRTRYAPQASWIVRNVVMSNNVMAESGGNCLVCVQDFSLQYTGSQMVSSINGNLYHRTSPGTPRWFSAWSKGSVSRDPAVTDTLAAFTAATGQDRRSQFVEGGPVVDGGYVLLPASAAVQGAVAVPVPSDIASVSRLPGNSTTLGALPR